MKKTQLAKLGLTLGLVGAVGVGGTMALLSAQSKTVTNTFTVGKGLHDSDITLDEAKVDPNTGKEITGEGKARVQENTYNNLEQGAELDKDPTVSIKNSAADCYVFVKIEGIDEKYYDVTRDENWIETTESNVYVYSTDNEKATVVSGGLTDGSGLVFNGVKIKNNAPLFTDIDGNGEWEKANLPQIVVKACAVQANNVTYEEALASATFAQQ